MRDSGSGLMEQKLFATTYAIAKSTGVTKSKLLTSIDHYISILEKKKNIFSEYFNNILQEKVQVPLDKIQSNIKTVNTMQQQVIELNQKIQELRWGFILFSICYLYK